MAKPSSGDPIYGDTKVENSNDRLTGGDRGEIIDGKGGNDIIQGNGGNDTIYGGSGDDYLIDGFGNDLVFAGEGVDRIEAGAGNDVFVLTDSDDLGDVVFFSSSWKGGFGNDTIDGFESGDTLKLQGVTQEQVYLDPNDPSTYIINAPNGGTITFINGYVPLESEIVFTTASNA